MEDIQLEVEIKNSPIPISIKETENILYQMKNCVCKIYTNKGSTGTGFFCKIPFPDKSNLICLLTNNHVLNEDDIKDNNNIYFSIGDNNENKSISINKKRRRFTNKDLDITFIEIKSSDNINNFLEIDDDVMSKDFQFLENTYKSKSIYVMHYPKGEEEKLSIGLLKSINDNKIIHLCNTDTGSSGAPILSLTTSKVLGIHFGGKNASLKSLNLGTFIKFPILKFFEESINIQNSNNINTEYIKKINYKFNSEPKKLKYKQTIIKTNDLFGANDLFEVFISYKDNKEYIVSPNFKTFNLDILSLLDNSLIKSLKGHKNHITTIRYFINNKDYKEYLISGDQNQIVIIWDISENYNIKYQINTGYKYGKNIYSCLLVFLDNINDNFIVTSIKGISDDNNSATKIYSFNNGEYIRYIKDSSLNAINYLLYWHNKDNNKFYIIQLAEGKILINNLLEDELYAELKQESKTSIYCGFISNKNNKDYLFSTSKGGNINIWDLYNKNLFKTININSYLVYIIEWNNKYIITGDYNTHSFKIFDIEKYELITDIGGEHTGPLTCVKKVNHPLYGESLLTASWDKNIKLWCL